jgi:hypothetical protein
MLLEIAVAQTGDSASMKPVQGNPDGVAKIVEGGTVVAYTAPAVPESAGTHVVLAANPKRVGAIVYNDSTQALFLRFHAGAATAAADHNVKLAAGERYTVPFGYAGAITGLRAAADGAAVCRVSEFTSS